MAPRLSHDEYMRRAIATHGDTYDYSKTTYIKYTEHMTITCRVHGDFRQRPADHIRAKVPCKKCRSEKRSHKHLFEQKAKAVHGDIYDYSKVNYINCRTNVIIICPKHGEFQQRPDNHIDRGHGCTVCSDARKTTDEFIADAKAIHDDKYVYDSIAYVNNHTKLCIICPKHGTFWQDPRSHLNGNGCWDCAREIRTVKDDFIPRSKAVHSGKYDYSLVEYYNGDTPVTIICPKHGEFNQRPAAHMLGKGCGKCRYDKARRTTEEFIADAKAVHGDRYSYSNTMYTSARDKVAISCHKHGEFIQIANVHLQGSGCPRCYYKTEGILFTWLKERYPDYDIHTQFHIDNRRFDFMIKELDLIIELDGAHHFEDVSAWNTTVDDIVNNDTLKAKMAMSSGYSVIRIPQGDVWHNRRSWDTTLSRAIHRYDSPTIIYLGDSIYARHRKQ